jgi:hypothetical protein
MGKPIVARTEATPGDYLSGKLAALDTFTMSFKFKIYSSKIVSTATFSWPNVNRRTNTHVFLAPFVCVLFRSNSLRNKQTGSEN